MATITFKCSKCLKENTKECKFYGTNKRLMNCLCDCGVRNIFIKHPCCNTHEFIDETQVIKGQNYYQTYKCKCKKKSFIYERSTVHLCSTFRL